MKHLIILILFFGLASSLLLHSQAVKITTNKAVQVGSNDPKGSLSWPGQGYNMNGPVPDVHILTFGKGDVFSSTAKTDWNWGIQYAGHGLSFIYNTYDMGASYPYSLHRRTLFLSDSDRVGIGTINPQCRLDVDGTARAYNFLTISDKRLKKDIIPLITNTYDLNKLNSITYKRNYLETEPDQITDKDTNTHYGFIAQELREIYPELVFEDAEGYLSVNYIGMIPVLVNAIKELRAEIDGLKSEKALRNTIQDITTSAALYQNNPNPFSERTEIKYYIPSVVVNATLCVYDLNGSQILKMDIAGRESGSISINANQLKAGMYLYTLLVDGKEVDTKKMILTGE